MININIGNIRTIDAGSYAWTALATRVRSAVASYAWTGRTGKSDGGPTIGFGPRAVAEIDEAVAEALVRAVTWAADNGDAPFGNCIAIAIGTGRNKLAQAIEGRVGGRRTTVRTMDPDHLPEGEADAADQAMQDREASLRLAGAINRLSAMHRGTVQRLMAGEDAPADCTPDAWRRRVCDARAALRREMQTMALVG